MVDPEDVEEMTKAPKADAHFARVRELEMRHAAMNPPAPEFDNEVTQVARTEMMSDIPGVRDSAKPIWKPMGRKK